MRVSAGGAAGGGNRSAGSCQGSETDVRVRLDAYRCRAGIITWRRGGGGRRSRSPMSAERCAAIGQPLGNGQCKRALSGSTPLSALRSVTCGGEEGGHTEAGRRVVRGGDTQPRSSRRGSRPGGSTHFRTCLSFAGSVPARDRLIFPAFGP